MERGQFTFYRSFYTCIRKLKPADQTKVVLAICGYALDGVEPELDGTTSAIFELVRPTLDNGIIKATNRLNKMKTNEEQTDNKTNSNENKQEQTDNKKKRENKEERENKREDKKEIKNDSYNPPISPPEGADATEKNKTETEFDLFWAAYPRKVGKDKALASWKKIPKREYPAIVPALEVQKQSAQWQKNGGEFIPYPATWLNQGRWKDEPDNAGTAQTEAVKDYDVAGAYDSLTAYLDSNVI